MIRIAVVDDHQIVRQGLTNILELNNFFKVVFTSENGIDLFEKLEDCNFQVDIILLDLQMPIMDGFETCEKLKKKKPNIKVIILSQLGSKESIKNVLKSGANGYLTKNIDSKSLHNAIERVYKEDFYFDMKLSDVIREAMLIKDGLLVEDVNKKSSERLLSDREIEIVELISREFNTGEIADKLCLNYRTIESHRKRIMTKVGAKNFIGVVIFAIKNGLINIENM
mgnify:CR=1 FL=1